MAEKADIGLIGLAVMGENLILNIESKGYKVSVYNRTTSKVDKFIEGRGKDKDIIGTHSVERFVESLKKPRKIIIMVKAGNPVDAVIEQLIPHLEKGDIIIDGGNSNFNDTIRRTEYVENKGLFYIGTGISGGEEGALHGPSIMPGGSPEAWKEVKEIFQSIAAKAEDGTPCCEWIGKNGAGHFVKMVHNGIEYGDMQLICESYFIMKELIRMTPDEMHEVFKDWNKGELNSYLIEITADIMAFKDKDGKPLIDRILDTAGQKGTGKWTSIAALNIGAPLTLISEAVFARIISAFKEERVEASKILKGPKVKFKGDKKEFIEDIRKALYASKIVSYAQGFTLLRWARVEYEWNLNFTNIASIWRNGCIIRSVFLKKIMEAFEKKSELKNLLLAPFFKEKVMSSQDSWRKVTSTAINNGLPVPALSSALAYFDGYRTERLSANLIQALRDYFGAHMYERLDKPRGEFYHTNWTGKGGDTSSTAYTV